MTVESALAALQHNPRFFPNIARWETMPARLPRYAATPPGLDSRLMTALAERGVEALYAHQAEAITAALQDEHVAVVTPAAR